MKKIKKISSSKSEPFSVIESGLSAHQLSEIEKTFIIGGGSSTCGTKAPSGGSSCTANTCAANTSGSGPCAANACAANATGGGACGANACAGAACGGNACAGAACGANACPANICLIQTCPIDVCAPADACIIDLAQGSGSGYSGSYSYA